MAILSFKIIHTSHAPVIIKSESTYKSYTILVVLSQYVFLIMCYTCNYPQLSLFLCEVASKSRSNLIELCVPLFRD